MTPSSTPHAPFGAHASFHFGPVGSPAGFALPSGTAPAQDVFVGCRPNGRAPWSLLPFFSQQASGPQPLPKGRFGRFLGWAGDKWMIGPLVFKLATPFSLPTADDDEKFRYCPVICSYLEYDNSHSEDAAELVFALGGEASPLTGTGFTGYVFGSTHGFVTAANPEVAACSGAQVFDADLPGVAALHFTVPPQARRLYPLVLAFHQPGFFYAPWFADLSAVAEHGLIEHSRYLALADARDAELMRSRLTLDERNTAALAVRSWLAHSCRRAGETEPDFTPLAALCRAVTG